MKVFIIGDNTSKIMKCMHVLVEEGIDVRYSLHVNRRLWQDVSEYDPDVFILSPLTKDYQGNIIEDMIHNEERYEGIPIFLLCDISSLAERVKALGKEFNGYIATPLEKDDFLSKIKILGGLREILKICNTLTKEI